MLPAQTIPDWGHIRSVSLLQTAVIEAPEDPRGPDVLHRRQDRRWTEIYEEAGTASCMIKL